MNYKQLLVTLLVLLGFGLPMEVRADDFTYNAGHYSCMQVALDKVRFTLPTGNLYRTNDGVQEGYVYVSVDGGADQTLLAWKCDKYSQVDEGCKIQAFQDGKFTLTGKVKDGDYTFSKSNGEISYKLNHNDDNSDHYTTTVDWQVPYSMRGKKLTLKVWAHVNWGAAGDWHVPSASERKVLLNWDCPAAPAVDVTLNDPMLSYDRAHANQTMMTYSVTANSIKSLVLHYTDAITGQTYTQNMSTKDLVGFAYIPADRPWKNIYMTGRVVNMEQKEVDIAAPDASAWMTCNMLHHPKDFKVEMMQNGTAQLSWSVDEPTRQDIDEGDFFEIQRNLMGTTDATDPYWTTISMDVSFKQGVKDYTFTDNTLMDSYKGYPVAYRIRRSATAIWAWGPGSGHQLYMSPSVFSLPQIDNATVQRTGIWTDDAHNVQFNFDFNAKHDSKGRTLIHTQAEWDAFKTLYSKDEATKNSILVLKDENSWEVFKKIVESGYTKVTAVMANDITLNDFTYRINGFAGEFDGCGHTLTLKYYSNNIESAAPFRAVNGGYFHNLTVAGSITSTAKFMGGLIGLVNYDASAVTIENCNIIATLTSKVNGDASSGGFIGIMESGTTVNFKNCSFHGKLQGNKSNNNAGFVGVAVSKTTINFAGCMFDPESLPIDMTNCRTFARADQTATVTFDDKCYYTRTYCAYNDGDEAYFVINNENDWDVFLEIVNDAAGSNKVNAILGADFSISKAVNCEQGYYGIFNGNGHTLNVNLNSESAQYMAPFVRVKGGSTFKNLHVTGSVRGAIHCAGLIGTGDRQGGEIKIENVWVSTEITCTSTHAGGIVGHCGDSPSNPYTINNCLFDGKVTSTVSGQYVGAIIGWGQGPNNKITNCLENGSYENFAHCGMNYADGNSCYGNNGSNTNNYTYHNWGEVGNDYKNAGNILLLHTKLGSGWKINRDPYPSMTTVDELLSDAVRQGKSAENMSVEEILAVYGTDWQEFGNSVAPTIREVNDYNAIVMWDPRALLKLRVNMTGENGTYSNIVDLSDNTDALNKHQFNFDLTSKCVEYDFDLMIIRNSSQMKIFGTSVNGVYPDTLAVKVKKMDKGDLANYRYMNLARFDSIRATTKQSSVVLNWGTSGGESDFYRVLRRDHGTTAWTDTIADNIQQTFVEDKKVYVQQVYDYMVESITQCEGVHIVRSDVETGNCEPTAMVCGYVRMADGTGMAGVKVIITPEGDLTESLNSAQYEVFTDNTGYYEKKGLKYRGEGKFKVNVPITGDMKPFTGGGEITFSTKSNMLANYNFYQDQYVVYSGNVYYSDTSIPVPGVSFKLDGKPMYDASKNLIETDNQGSFSLSIPHGAHSVQAVKDGHILADNGFLMNPDEKVEDRTQYNFEKNVASVYIWDSTTVVLRGRVVGGDIEGSKPLGSSLSKNNLGDSLKIVLQLEGDNTSWMIRNPKDETVKSASYKVPFGEKNAKGVGKDTTQVYITRHMLTIRPDSKTGEYELKVHPAKYKVVEVSGQGYATLFQQGKVGETIDLAFNVQGDTCEYSRIYHATPTVEVTQFNPGSEKYYGVKKLKATDNIGNEEWMNLYYYEKLSETDSIGRYSFGYPVFMAGSPYGWMLQACEKYYYNNNVNREPDIVKLDSRGKITIKNYLIGTNDGDLTKTLTLDEYGGASYIFTPQNTTFTLENDMALKNVSITLEYDSCFYDIKPFNGGIIKGYVMATKPKADGRKVVVAGTPMLFDILRDPPGSGSSAYLEEGSKLSYGYSADLTASLGYKVKGATGSNGETYHGTVAAPSGAGESSGTLTHYKSEDNFVLDIRTNFGYSWSYSYNLDVTERIQTKSGQKWIGGKADLFIGTTEDVIVQDAMAVRVIPEKMYQLVKLHEGGSFTMEDKDGNTATVKVPVGTTKVLAKGTDDQGKPIYLVRDEVMQVSPTVKSTFVHSQNYIENELLPDLMKMRNSLLLPKGTSEADAKKLANKQGYATYISAVDADHEDFGLKYTTIYPDGGVATGDSIASLNNEMMAWVGILAQNEQEKLSVLPTNRVKRYDFDGGMSSIQYSESFSTSESESRYLRYPVINGLGNVASGVEASILSPLLNQLEKLIRAKKGANGLTTYTNVNVDNDGNMNAVEVKVLGSTFTIKRNMIAEANFNDKYNTSKTHSKKTGFTLSAASKSSLTVDVYRTAGRYSIDKNANQFNKFTLDMLDDIRNGKLTPNALNYLPDTVNVYSNFVFRTVGGVTCQPYEGQRVTKWYMPGTELDAATIPADKPRIWIEEPVQSNVPFDKPARYVLHLANETDYPDRATLVFNYFLPAGCNPKGAKICVDGAPLTGTGANAVLYPAVDSKTGKVNVFTKEITVYPGDDFDYEDLAISLMDPEDAGRVFTANFSAHFIPSAGDIKVTTPSDHWVVNTESPYDGNRKAWYMPVRIEGFNVNGRGFDHIELQYKLTTQGEKDWVSVCSYYANDSLRQKASGVTDTIPSNGIIVAPFYGEVDPVEQYYDLRAVVYARHAGGYLTNASPILTGIKDTRLPRPFGTPEPTDGILGIGEDIKIAFSEPIASNYLSKINNFEVLGTPVSTNISTSTSVTFNGESTIGFTQGNRNMKGKSFTVDVMVNPASDRGEMTIFAHGGSEKGLRFGLTADRHLKAEVNGTKVVSNKAVQFNNTLHQIAYTLEQGAKDMTITFYDGSTLIGTKTINGVYEQNTPIYIGVDEEQEEFYKGNMLEFRLWNRPMDGADLDDYSGKTLTGFESGLLDYYKLNEGEGSFSYDKAPGSLDLNLANHTWKRPVGISMKLDGKNGVQLNTNQKFNRSKNHDYTLMFWFRTSDENGTLLSNGEAQRGQSDQLNIGLEDGALYVRSSGFEHKTDSYVDDNEWHSFAMTVSRNRNVANIYVDKRMVETFAADSLSGFEGDIISLGATYDKKGMKDALTGNIDEVGMFESVLPVDLLLKYTTHTPIATTKPLMFYLDFGRSEHLNNNEMRLQPTGISIKRYVDGQSKILERCDTLMTVDEAFVDRDYYAPMNSNAQLENLKYSYVAKDNELLIELEEPDFMVEKTNVYVTVKEIPDMQGNLMASPLTMNLYVYRNPLRWNMKKLDEEIDYGQEKSIEVKVQNLSGQTQNFDITDLPIWITASKTSGTVSALGEEIITLNVSPYINIGTYTEQITLVGYNSMSEPLPITLKVRGEEPEWAVGDKVKKMNQSMMMVARVKINGVVTHSTEDIIGVFDDDNQTLGVAHIEVDNTAYAHDVHAFLTIYGYTNDDGTQPNLNFKFFQASSGKVYNLEPEDEQIYTFKNNAIVGTADKPVILENDFNNVQWMTLKAGWNWVSFNVVPEDENVTVGEFLNKAAGWEPGDIITSVNGTNVQQWVYHEVENTKKTAARTYKWDHEDEKIDIDATLMYRIYSSSAKTAYFEGWSTYEAIKLRKGWNRIAYLSSINLPIAQALSGYQANAGDVIKSQDAFAVATNIQDHIVWKGSLQYLEKGKGYMLKRQAEDETEFYYPLYWNNSRYSGNTTAASAPRRNASVNTSTTMNIVASVAGVETEPEDVLVVYRGTEKLAEAVADEDQNYYLNIGCDTQSKERLTFTLERDDEVVATTRSLIPYEANDVQGTPDVPTEINFTPVDPSMYADGNWYTLTGIQLQSAPKQPGCYIHNGKVKSVKF